MEKRIEGWGVDRKLEDRPGVPMEKPTTQPDAPRAIVVRSSAVPPRGLSRFLRRRAYRIPDHMPRHWLYLMMADRVDAVEHGFLRPVALLFGFGLASAGARYLRRRFA